MPTPLSHPIRITGYPPHTRVADVARALAAHGMRLRQTRHGLIAVRVART